MIGYRRILSVWRDTQPGPGVKRVIGHWLAVLEEIDSNSKSMLHLLNNMQTCITEPSTIMNLSDTSSANEKSRLTSNVALVTGKLFCGYHQGYGDAQAGSYLNRNGRKMWMCAACMKLLGIAAR